MYMGVNPLSLWSVNFFIRTVLCNVEYQRFFTALSVRPGSMSAIARHFNPFTVCSCKKETELYEQCTASVMVMYARQP